MKIIIIALKEEINLDLNKYKKDYANNTLFYYLSDDLVLAFSGVSKTNATICLTNLLYKFNNVEFILNIGTAGSYDKKESAYLCNKFQFLDVDAIDFGYEVNQTPRMNKFYEFEFKQINNIYEILKEVDNNSSKGICGTSDSFINQRNHKQYTELNKVNVFDMESASLAQTAYLNKINFVAIKFISDSIINPKFSENQFNENLKLISHKIEEIIKRL